mmetsp:Transcript_13564/g.42814  ORF Transcript_13564/g.42814 Transcript_13564/m.42814 type:complete len:149 (+) Transcript_13564:524-970(+)
MAWTGQLYGGVFQELGLDLQLRENDYIIDQTMKVGGNAQSIVKGRWLHHTSFLWDFQDADMLYLSLPRNRPDYRGDRDHSDFVTRIAPRLQPATFDASADHLAYWLQQYLDHAFDVELASPQEAMRVLDDRGPDWHGNTRLLDPSDLA